MDLAFAVAPSAGFALLAVLLTWPLAANAGHQIRDLGDPLLNTWILAWGLHAAVSHPLSLFDANIFYPFPGSLAYSEALVGAWPLAAPVMWLSNNPILVHNVLVITSFALSGIAVYYLTLELTQRPLAAFVAGVVFAFCPYRFGQYSHLQLQLIQWLPLIFLCLHRIFRRGRNLDFVLFSIVFAVQALSSFYYAFFATIAVVVFLAFEFVTQRATLNRLTLTRLIAAFICAGLIILPFGLPYFEIQRLFGFQRSIGEVVDLSASFEDFFSAPPENRLYGALTHPLMSQSAFPLEHMIFPGFVGLLLLVVGMVSIGWRRHPPTPTRWAVFHLEFAVSREQGRYLLLLVVAFVLALGPYLRVFGHVSSIPLPYFFLYELVPGFKALRAPVRFEILFQFGLAICAGYGVLRIQRVLERSRLQRPAVWLALGAIPVPALGEFVNAPLHYEDIGAGQDVPAVYRWLAGVDSSSAVAEMPSSVLDDAQAAYYSTYHWHPLANGYSGFLPPNYPELAAQINAFPEPQATARLRALGIRYIIVHGGELGPTRMDSVVAEAGAVPGVQHVQTFGSDSVFELSALEPGDPSRAHIDLEVPTLMSPDAASSAVLGVSNNQEEPLVLGLRTAERVSVAWDGGANSQSVAAAVPLFVDPGEKSLIAVPLGTIPAPGQHTLAVHLEGPIVADATQRVQVKAGLATSTSADALEGTISDVHAPSSVHVGQALHLTADVTNTGEGVWLAQPDGHKGQVGLGVRWWTAADGSRVVDASGADLGARGWLANNLLPGQEAEVTLDAPTPSTPGQYTVHLELVSELIAWFSAGQQGAGLNLQVAVVS